METVSYFESVLHYVMSNGLNLERVEPDMRNNRDIVEAAVRSDASSLQYASDELKHDHEFLLHMANTITNGYELEKFIWHIPTHLRNDFDIMFSAVQKNGSIIRLAHSDLCDNKKMILAAMSNFADAFRYASKRLRNSLDIINVAVRLDGMNIMYSNFEELVQNTDVLYEAIYNNTNASKLLSKEFQRNSIVCYIVRHAHVISISDWKVVKQALKLNPKAMLSPPPSIVSIFSEDALPYLSIAEYALHGDMTFTTVEPFDFCN